ncbi:helix-turn-helix domain-containing protein [Ruegeria hyattellae]|uniref:helix-turn-helix domain-containing protein n=1 Tax=Ruegeria hyattellae TaxID=3233337 RepID=UPI00355B1D31
MATRAGMSRAVFHRRFKQGMTVNEAAMDVGYVCPSQFSREFKRMCGQSPRQWNHSQRAHVGAA